MLSSFSHNNFTHACAAYVYAISKFKQKSNQVKKERKKKVPPCLLPTKYTRLPLLLGLGKGSMYAALPCKQKDFFATWTHDHPVVLGQLYPWAWDCPSKHKHRMKIFEVQKFWGKTKRPVNKILSHFCCKSWSTTEGPPWMTFTALLSK